MNTEVSFDDLLHLGSDFEESDLPYEVDLVCYPGLKNDSLKEHIDRVWSDSLRGVRFHLLTGDLSICRLIFSAVHPSTNECISDSFEVL